MVRRIQLTQRKGTVPVILENTLGRALPGNAKSRAVLCRAAFACTEGCVPVYCEAVGADASIFVFDYERYRSEIVPALVELLRTGEPVRWLREVFREATPDREYGYDLAWPRMAHRLADQPIDLAKHCQWMGEDLRYLGDEAPDRLTLICPSLTCPERGHCVFHRERHAVEELNALHEALVATRCLGRSQFLGRNFTPYCYEQVLDRHAVPADDRVRELLAALGMRGAVLGYQFGVTEGIHGWLSIEETAELAGRLDGLPLPRFEPAFATMYERHQASRRDGDSNEAWQELSLSFVRTVSAIAAGLGRAVLWGNDVSPNVWTETWGVARA
jgi:hypothetical protein